MPGERSPRSLDGRITIAIDDRRRERLDYWGYEEVLHGPRVEQLRGSRFWPRIQAIEGEVRDKSEPHVACTLTKLAKLAVASTKAYSTSLMATQKTGGMSERGVRTELDQIGARYQKSIDKFVEIESAKDGSNQARLQKMQESLAKAMAELIESIFKRLWLGSQKTKTLSPSSA